MSNIYNKLSEERKSMQASGEMPEFFTTAGWQLFKTKYLWEAKTPNEQYRRIAKTLAKHAKSKPADWGPERNWEDEFYKLMTKGWLSLSTPLLSNTGTDRGFPVSCSGNVIQDNIQEIYKTKLEVATLTKYGFGTATDLSDISPRGTITRRGVKCSGVVPIIQGIVQDMDYTSQGSNRRGSWAGYINIMHGDFYEICSLLETAPDSLNIGWIIKDEFIKNIKEGSEELKRYQLALKVKMTTGKGYFFFVDKANRARPQWLKDRGLEIRASQLCTEIMLPSDYEHTYTCILSSMNASKYDEWKDTDAPFIATVLLDCTASEFIEKAKGIVGLEKAVAYTEKGRSLGLGVCGFHTYLQEHMMPFGSFEAYLFNQTLFKQIREQADKATRWMAKEWGEPEWCATYGVRNSHLIAVAPTKSTALILGGISEGINPDPAFTYTQQTPAGEVNRVNPVLLKIMKARNVYDEKHIQEIIDNYGSVQKVDWLTPEEKEVFKTAFEINQKDIIRLAAARQKYIDQGQSLNLFFSSEESEGYISEVHKEAFLSEDILSLYYCYSKAGVQASKGECSVCQ